MENTNLNPLAKHFRQPVIHTKLVSNGKFWPEGSLNLPVTGEIPVYAMTLKDEIILKTPDALMNGSGVVEVIQSCCPSITNAWDMPSIDVDSIIIAIRIASYGEHMDVSAKCPNCKEENEFRINLHQVLDSIKSPDFSTPVEFPDFKIYLKPQKYFDLNKRNKITFEEQQLLRLAQSSSDENTDKDLLVVQFSKHLANILDLNFEALTSSTDKVVLNDGTVVTNRDHILEFYRMADGTVSKKIQTKIQEIANSIAIKPFEVKCPHCDTEYKIEFTFDYANFFA